MFREKLRFSQLTDASLIAFLIALTTSVASPVFPIFAERIAGTPQLVGLIASVFGLSAIFINIYIMRFFEKDGVVRNLAVGLLLYALVYASYLFVNSVIILALMQIVFAAAVCFSWTALSILVNDSSRRRDLGSSDGKYFTFMNFGALIGVFSGGMIAISYSYSAVFLLAALSFTGIYFLARLMDLKDRHKPHKRTTSALKDARHFFADKNLRRTYISSVGLYFWVSIAFLYLPIILKSFGFNFKQIGFAFAAMIIPYLMIEYPVGRLAEKHGSGAYISLGFLAMAVASFLIYKNYGSIFSMLLFFFLSFMGAASIEPLNEMNLDRHSRKNILENMPIFKTSLRLAYFLGPITAAILISLVGLEKMFLVLSVIMAGFWWVVRR